MLRRMAGGSGHRSILRIGPAGENRSAMACINVDTYRHFGRLGGGAVMGAKNLKAIVIVGDASFDLPPGKEYAPLFQKIYGQLTETTMMDKYHNLGTPINVAVLNKIKALPCRNLQRTSDEAISGITGETFADRTLLRNTACAGCPVGCIHLGFLREKFSRTEPVPLPAGYLRPRAHLCHGRHAERAGRLPGSDPPGNRGKSGTGCNVRRSGPGLGHGGL